ncbi:hypothetical protein SLEP1_g1701 [Rubroshorea leprosula]|uniref:Uncharacterized protein n=1 Tax=Rubroshorea leprosula TaxID=152421 RepID=A0AAV5HLS3_9ROSI|nr:hypothetical protein SLEP1_g1701 [Rubroshorea leprosula]
MLVALASCTLQPTLSLLLGHVILVSRGCAESFFKEAYVAQ